MPSTWNFAGAEARTAATVFAFHVSTASGGVATGSCGFAVATDSQTAPATATRPETTSSFLIRILLLKLQADPPAAAGLSPYGVCRRLDRCGRYRSATLRRSWPSWPSLLRSTTPTL